MNITPTIFSLLLKVAVVWSVSEPINSDSLFYYYFFFFAELAGLNFRVY